MATTLADVHSSEKEGKEKSKISQLDSIVLPKKVEPQEERVPELANVIFKLVKKKRGRFYLDNCCNNVLNPKTGKRERIWLLSGANSIWDTELEYILKDKDRYERARRGMEIIFVDGVCRVQATDGYKLEFMRMHASNVGKRRNGSGKQDFYEYNPAEEQLERHQKQLMKIEMVLKAKEMTDTQVMKLASFLGIKLYDEDLGLPKSPEGVRTELMISADNDPATFQKYIDSREVEVSWMVRRAIQDNKIDLGGESRSAMWANGKGFISKIPALRKPLEYLTELALTNSSEGKTFKEQLESFVV